MGKGTVLNELALFAGAGGGILGGKLLGWRTVCAVEINSYCARVLAQRQNDGILEPFPIWDDVRTFEGGPWRGSVDVVSGGFPCQDISCAGKGKGIKGEQSGLWSQMGRIVGEVRPRYVFVENSPALRVRGLAVVLKDLALLGYNAQWCRLSAENIGAPHIRDRIWILAEYSDRFAKGLPQKSAPHPKSARCYSAGDIGDRFELGPPLSSCDMQLADKQPGQEGPWTAQPRICRMVDGLAHGVDRLRASGNGQVPGVAALAWEILTNE